MSPEGKRKLVRLDLNIPEQVSVELTTMAQETGENLTEAVKGSIRVRRKVRTLIAQGGIVLAHKDADGKLTEFGPISILE